MEHSLMKDSGVEWIGEIPSNWSSKKIRQVCTCRDEERVPVDASLRKTGPYPYWGAGKVTDYVDDYLFDEELVLLGEDGAPFFDKTRDVAHIVNEKVWINNHIHVLKADKDVSARYLCYFLNIVDYGSYINGSILNKLTQSNMNKINIAFPNASKQNQITRFLDSKTSEIESLIDNLNKQIESLKEYKKSLIYKCVTKGLDDSVPLKDSGIEWIGEIPENWHTEKLLNLLRCKITDGPHETPDLVDDGIPFVSVDSLNETEDIDFSVVRKFISEDDYNEYRKKTNLEEGDILFSKAATIGKTAIVKKEKFMIWSPLAIVKSDSSKCYNKYLYYVLNCDGLIKHIGLLGGYNTQVNVGMRSLECAPVPVPPLAYQLQITRFLDFKTSEIKSLIDNLNKLIESLKEYKKSLIYEYVTGKKEVITEGLR